MKRRPCLATSALGLALAVAFLVSTGCRSEADPEGSSSSGTASAGETARSEAEGDAETTRAGGARAEDVAGPRELIPDRYREDRRAVEPALGGTIVFNLSAQPPSLNFALENSASVRWVLNDVHAALLRFNKETFDYDLELATKLEIEDMVVLKDGDIRYGNVSDAGDAWELTPGSERNGQGEQTIAKDDVDRVERGTVLTFELRDDALWHDGHPFDARDVKFSYDIYANQIVDCDEKRFNYTDDVFRCDVLDDHAVRFFYDEQFFNVRGNFTLDFCVLPSHHYNLLDPDNPAHEPEAELLGQRQGEFVNNHPNNHTWIGLGPYRVVEFKRDEYITAEKFDNFWTDDPRVAGYVDRLRWRLINDDDTAFEALLAGELDLFMRVKTEDYKGAATQDPAFTEQFYKAHTYTGYASYVTWNMYRPYLSDVRVRQALSHAFDHEEWIRTNYLGLAVPITGMMFRFGPGYDTSIEPAEFDPDTARDLLADAGWYDRDGDGFVDKDGQNLELEILMPSGNKASERYLQKMQSYYADVGVAVSITGIEWAQFLERLHARDFDGGSLAWVLNNVESDPYQLWHSSQAAYGVKGSNHSGLVDEEVDELIATGRRELDAEKRSEIWHELHARLYELKPYLFGYSVPRKIAINKDLWGVKLYNFDPGFRLRDMYYEYDPETADEEGLRPVPAAYRDGDQSAR